MPTQYIFNQLFLGFVVFLMAILIALVLYHGKRNQNDKIFVLFTTASIFWVVSNIIANYARSIGEAEYLFWAKVTIIGPAFIPLFMYMLSCTFPNRKINFRSKQFYLFYVVTFFIVALSPTAFNIQSVTITDPSQHLASVTPGFAYTVLALYICAATVLSIIRFLKKSNKKNKSEASQARIIVIGIVLSILVGLFLNAVLPLVGIANFISIGPAAVIFFIIFTTYAIIRHNLFDIKLFAAEIITGSLSIFLLIYVFFSQSTFDYFIRGLAFVVVFVLSILLIRNLTRELENKKQLEKLTQDLETANKRLKQLDKTKSEFLSIASHQLRTPISGIKGYLSMILEGDLGKVEGQTKEVLQQIYDNTERLNGLVNDFLDVSRIERGKMTIEREETDMVEMVSSIFTNFKPVAKERNLEFTFEPPSGNTPKVNVDPNKLRQVILNVVDNALKYIKEGSVAVKLDTNDKEYICTVTDTGVGLEKDEAEKLFRPFVRAKDASKANTTGSGLGLYVARKIIQYHAGTIHAESPGKGKGSSFIITVPFDQSNIPEPEPEPYLE